MLAIERGLCTSSEPTGSSLHQLMHDPLLYISKWYNGMQAGTRRNALEAAVGDGESASHFKLHESAENCLSSLRAGTASIVLQEYTEEGVQFVNLPVGVHLHIFSFLDVRSLCRLSQTCSYLQSLTSDHLLWKRMLKRDLHLWKVIGHLSHPQVYEDASSDLSPKEIYCNCHTLRNALPGHSFAHPITGRLRSLVRKIQGHVPRVLMFGSGLESVPLVRTLLWEDASPYRPVGLYPGKDGIGSGVCILHRNTPINLITLYTATRAERKAAASGTGSRVNKLVSTYSEDSDGGPELTQAVQQLCHEADAFVLVVDASKKDRDSLDLNLTMLNAMFHSRSQQTALLVLSCQMDSHSDILSPVQVAERHRLCELTHPWQVRSLVIETYEGIQGGFDWLLGASHT